jgi:hypothetical protein
VLAKRVQGPLAMFCSLFLWAAVQDEKRPVLHDEYKHRLVFAVVSILGDP